MREIDPVCARNRAPAQGHRRLMLAAALLAAAGAGCEPAAKESEKPAPVTAAAPAPKPAGTSAPRPNIIFILVDALRADRLGPYGRQPSITPTMDAVTDEGVMFERAVSQAPWTQPSIASLFSSYNPSVHQVFSYRQTPKSPGDPTQKVVVFGEAFKTLAECLHDGGYTTAAFVANPTIREEYGFGQGFDLFDNSMANKDSLVGGDVVNKAAIAWLKGRDAAQPFFLYLHYMDVHGPYNAGPQFLDDLLDEVEKNPKTLLTVNERDALGYLRKLPPDCPNPLRHKRLFRFREYWVARYESGVRAFDYHFAALRKTLAEMGLWDDTYVLITADHGEALCEHGLWSHGYSTHHSDLHVPLVLRWPGSLPRDKRISGTVRLIDVMPTLLAQLSIAAPDGIQGRSLLPLIGGESVSDPAPALAEGVKIGPKQRAVYLDAWKLIDNLETGRRQLFNVDNDYAEQLDLSLREPQRVEKLSAILAQLVAEDDKLARQFFATEAPISPEQLERLRQLGYVGG